MNAKQSKGIWLLPSRRRIGNLHTFFEACRTAGICTKGIVLVMESELLELKNEYDELVLPEGWTIRGLPGCDTQGDKVRAVWDEVKDLDWVGLIGDDNIPVSPHWDEHMVGGLQGWNFVSCNDSWQAPRRVANCWVMSGELLRTVGYIFPPGLNHLYVDDIWETIGRATQNWNCRMDILVKHNNHIMNKTEDETHKKAYSDTNWAHDSAIYEEWVLNERDAIIERVEAMKTSIGVVKSQVDLTGVSVMIATPSGSSKFCSEYVGSLYNTFTMFANNNVAFNWVIEGGNADLVAARAELFAAFIESDYSHLLMIDDDMGWDVNAIARLLWSKKDFVSVAGRKKRDTPIFALNVLAHEERVIEIAVDQTSGTAEVKEVGLAFSLFSRSCIMRMVEAYPELTYTLPGKEKRWSLCLPLFTKEGAYKAEDYAFCHRWRAIGGQVFVCPDVSIKHIGGMSVYEGSWADSWRPDPKVLSLSEPAIPTSEAESPAKPKKRKAKAKTETEDQQQAAE